VLLPDNANNPTNNMNTTSNIIDRGQLLTQAAMKNTDAVMGKLLQDAGKLKAQDMERVLKLQHEQGIRFGEAAVKLGLVTEADIQHALSFQFEYPNLTSGPQGLSQELVVAVSPYSKTAETLRSVRSQLLLRWFQQGHKTLALASPSKDEGASYLAANLAVLFAQLGKKTLLVDADMRAPSQHKLFNLGNSKGLSDILAGRADVGIVSPIAAFPTLSVLSAGSPPPNPSELLARPAFGELLGGFESSYDIVLIDTSSAQQVADVQAAAVQAGAVLISSRRNATRVAALAELKEKITVTGAQVIGAVVLD
jgi:chain length determinant protein tyrosine kinase EpsG